MPVVRSAELADSAAIAGLLAQLGYRRSVEEVRADLSAPQAYDVLVADDDVVVGMITLVVHYQLHLGGRVASVEALVVDDSSRSQNVGSLLVEAAVTKAKDAGCVVIELHSNVDRHRARRFYERHGFRVTSNYFVKSI